MFVRNFLSAGDYLEIAPIGLPITLQYNVSGFLEKVMFRYSNEVSTDLTDELKGDLLMNNKVPKSISVKTGTTWVQGVLYTENHPSSVGELPECLKDEYIEAFKEDPESFVFYAGNVSSMSTVFRGAVPIRQWLTLSGFELLPGFVIPGDKEFTESEFERLTSIHDIKIPYPLYQGYFVFKRNVANYYTLGFSQDVITGIESSMDNEGYLHVTLHRKNHNDKVVDYSEYVRMNLQKDVLIILDEEDNVLYTVDTKVTRKPLVDTQGYELTCKVCGKIYKFNPFGKVCCSDENCNSRLFPRVNHFLRTLGLSEISKYKYDEITKKAGPSFTFLDILDEDNYKDKVIEVSLSKLLRAGVPESIIVGPDAFNSFCNRCNNKVESVEYYIDNTEAAHRDLKLYDCNTSYTKFFKWLENIENNQDIHTLLHHERLKIVDTNMTLPTAAPIFRGLTILVSGKFRHGSIEDIFSLLSSYGATVVTRYSRDVTFVVLGDIKEDIKGQAIIAAKQDKKAIYEEMQFFKQYEIDADLAENLK